MGKGDRKTAKGKRFNASYGNARPHQTVVKAGTTDVKVAPAKTAAVAKKAPIKKAPAKKASS